MPMWINGSSVGAVLRMSASRAATSDLRGSFSFAMYAAGVFTLSWPFIRVPPGERVRGPFSLFWGELATTEENLENRWCLRVRQPRSQPVRAESGTGNL